jgi:protein-export membrane protein SecD
MRREWIWLIIILVLIGCSAWVALPDNDGLFIDSDQDNTPEIAIPVQLNLGLDIVGGIRVLLEAELPPDQLSGDLLQQTANNVSRRVNALGVTEPTVQVQGSSRILVELPGETDAETAVATIQQTALLEFVDFSGLGATSEALVGQRILTDGQLLIAQQRGTALDPSLVLHPLTGQPFTTVMTGAQLERASAQISEMGEWYIDFTLTPEGAQIFGPYTARSLGQPMAIVLDGVVLSAPTIAAQLTSGGSIDGDFTADEARTLAVQLRSGALPVPLRVISSEQVGATLGQESVTLSIRAGVIGVIVVLSFMLFYYRVPGLAADFALIAFMLLNFAIFKLVPVTLTLPAITGFLISIGTAVDGNILVFERIKEELRAGKPLDVAVQVGFQRAWQSIRDSNLSTILICGVLFFFGQTPGASLVAGFAVTLAIGLLVNLFTAVIVTRTVLMLLVHTMQRPLARRLWLLGV